MLLRCLSEGNHANSPFLQDLSAEATRARRDRQSILTPPTSGSEPPESINTNTRMALRTRKPAKPIVETVEEDDDRKPAPKANCRKTVAGATVLGDKVRLNFLLFSTLVRPLYFRAPKPSQLSRPLGAAPQRTQNPTLLHPSCQKQANS